MNSRRYKLAILPGDGIGKDVILSSLSIFDELNLPFDITIGDIGWEFWKKEGTPIPDRTWKLVESSDAVLVGAITSKPDKEALKELSPHLQNNDLVYTSPIIQLRQKLDLFVNVRPCFNIDDRVDDFNFCIIRENTEGLYAGFDYYPISTELMNIVKENPRWDASSPSELSCSLRIQSRSGLKRLFQFSFEYSAQKNMDRVTLADKVNVLRKSGLLAREVFEEVAGNYPNIQADIQNVDAVALWLTKRPDEFGVIVSENMFGDILSDVGASVMGGLGVAPSANYGVKGCYFEPVHGSAPRLKGNTANPTATFLTISLLLEKFDLYEQAELIRNAVKNVIKERKNLTYDFGGRASTREMSRSIVDQCLSPTTRKTISLIATGNEILSGDIQDVNCFHFSKIISQLGGEVCQHIHVSDDTQDIESALRLALNRSDAVIITGGLGPTSDDRTRYAVSNVTKRGLEFQNQAWEHVVKRLESFHLPVSDSNKQQALFPKNATLFPNENGTAFGCYVFCQGKIVFMLPGPPKESFPIFEKHILNILEKNNFMHKQSIFKWLTLGLIEGDISMKIDRLIKDYDCQIGYRWSYPYLEIKIILDAEQVNEQLLAVIETILENHTVSYSGNDSFQGLRDALELCENEILVGGDKVIQQFVSEYGHEKLLFDEKNSELTIDVERVDSVVYLQTIGRKGKTKYQHSLSTPNRGADIEIYIKHYAAWQINRFIEISQKG